jgi:hypothetical protein
MACLCSARHLGPGGQKAWQNNEIVCGEWHSMPLCIRSTPCPHTRLLVPIGAHESVPRLRALSRPSFHIPATSRLVSMKLIAWHCVPSFGHGTNESVWKGSQDSGSFPQAVAYFLVLLNDHTTRGCLRVYSCQDGDSSKISASG